MIDPNLGFDPIEDCSFSALAFGWKSRAHLKGDGEIEDQRYYRDSLFENFETATPPSGMSVERAAEIKASVRKDLDFNP